MNQTNDSTRPARTLTTQRRQRRKQGENRERLLTAGIAEFGAFGYFGASTSSIAKRAGVSQPHVYSNFNTKLDLFLACAERVIEQTKQSSAKLLHRSHATQDLRGRRGSQGSVRDAFRPDGQYTLISRFVYQLVAISGCSLDETLQVHLQQLQSVLSREELHQMIFHAASSLLPPVHGD